jgi:hypothetical protein
MVGVTTVALLQRKDGMSRDLFTRYWRDVHGVMAARIPGFDSYTQFHVTPLDDVGTTLRLPAYEGVAVVTFANESDRQGLLTSEVTKHIHRDEQNVFRGALLYSLPPGASAPVSGELQHGAQHYGCFLLVPEGAGIGWEVSRQFDRPGLVGIEVHDLSGGDPAAWNDTKVGDLVSGRALAAVIRGEWVDERSAKEALRATIAVSGGQLTALEVNESYVMVEDGRPTAIGLRGLDAVRTIQEAHATNQLEPAVIKAVYGPLGRR